MNHKRTGKGKPLLLIHGLGGSWRSWDPVMAALASQRDVIAVDLPGFGDTPPLAGPVTIGTLADALTSFLKEQDLLGIDAVGSSMGGRLVLELARRGGIVGAVVSLDPGGFWEGWERHVLFGSLSISIIIVRALQDRMAELTRSRLGRQVLFAQLSAHPERISPDLALNEMRSCAVSPSFDELLYAIVYGEEQQGSPKGTILKPLVIGWGLSDHVCFPGQAQRAMDLFGDAQLHWFKDCGHFPQWDSPQETVRLILHATSGE
ncbi:alpha/beta fold hydrolase [Flavihumibacter sp. R14]|nr:alpha/beta fold hydrolase [Flavihumibacter soli]